MIRFFGKRKGIEQKRQTIMNRVKEATRHGQCIILASSSEGTRIIVLGKSTLQSQLEQIAKDKGVIL